MIVPDFRIYKTNTTKYWREDIQEQAGTLQGIYIFNAKRHVHACELTPSFEMNYLGPTWSNHVEDEEQRDKLSQTIMDGDADTDPVMYVHVRSVNLDKCEKVAYDEADWLKDLADADGDEETAYKAALERRSEYCRCNGYTH